MRHDPTELRLSTRSDAAQGSGPPRASDKRRRRPAAPQAVDEAFASLVTQLEALDRQRLRLARLLDGIDAPTSERDT